VPEKPDQFFEERVAKLSKLEELGVDPFGSKFVPSDDLASIRAAIESEGLEAGQVGESLAAMAGRVVALRKFGKATFVGLQDRSGKMQGYLRKDEVGEDLYKIVKLLDIGDHLGVSGKLGKTKTGEPTVFATSLQFLGKALRPLPEKWHGLADTETRYRQRYLDLIANEEVRDRFVKRSRMISWLRNALADRNFIEVETPSMQAIPGGAAAKPFTTHHNTLDIDLYMRISPELYLKRLLVGGLDRVFEIGRNFRNEGLSPRHNPEFTMLELYQAYGDLENMIEITETLVSGLAEEINGQAQGCLNERPINLQAPWPRYDYLELLQEKTGVDPHDQASLLAAAKKAGVEVKGLGKWKLIDELFSVAVEPDLWDACFVLGQPREMAPLCKARADDPTRSERFEAFVAGMELANAYTELNDPLEQRRRFEEQAGGSTAEETSGRLDEDFLTAMEHGMPPAGGLGIGIDRLAMVLLAADSIREVVLFPQLKPRSASAPEGSDQATSKTETNQTKETSKANKE
jgi:lysyl-tRNA synthetase, class II